MNELLVYAAGAVAIFYIIKIVASIMMSVLKVVGSVLSLPLKVTGIWYIARWLFAPGDDTHDSSNPRSESYLYPGYKDVAFTTLIKPIGKVVMSGTEFYLFGLEMAEPMKYRVKYSTSKAGGLIRESTNWISSTKVIYF